MEELEKVIERLEYCAETRDGFVRGCVNDAIELIKNLEAQLQHACECYEEAEKELKKQEHRHRLEVHNIGNVDIPEGVSKEHFYLVMNNVVEALQHTDKGESYPYEGTGR